MDRPVLHCLVWRIRDDGRVGKAKLVTLGEAYLLFTKGTHVIVGPDPRAAGLIPKTNRRWRNTSVKRGI